MAEEDYESDNYLAAYCRFFDEFVKKVNPNDQLPVKVCTYDVTEGELVGEIISIALQYLNQIYCPPCLQDHLVHKVLEDIKTKCKTHPEECGLRFQEKTYAPLKLMIAVTSKLYEICHTQYLNNSQLPLWPPPATPLPIVVTSAIKNRRRKMEDRHVVLHNLHSIFNVQSDFVANYYAVFDGHGGQDAAIYCATHLHQYLVESIYYPTDPERALRDAFLSTDAHFIKKTETQKVSGGSTAVCVLIIDKKLYTAWVGDSRAMLVRRQGQTKMLVNPHRPCRQDEMQRINNMGGFVTNIMGVSRVQGVLGVTRAIGDVRCKPYVTGEPEIHCEELDGTEDFIIIACDGFWDFVDVKDAVTTVYENIHYENNIKQIITYLVGLAKVCGSQDNITVILVFLTPPKEIAARPRISTGSNNYARHNLDNMDILGIDESKRGLREGEFDYLAGEARQDEHQQQCENGDDRTVNDNRIVFEASSNGKHENGEEYEDDEDLGPETDVDAVDDIADVSCTPLEKLSRELFPDEKTERHVDLEMEGNDEHVDNEVHADDDGSPPSPPRSNKALQHAVISEADNVADSEDSEDEWNYYRIDPNKEKDEPATSPLDDEAQEAKDIDDESSSNSSQRPESHQSPEPFEEDNRYRNPEVESYGEDRQRSPDPLVDEEKQLEADDEDDHQSLRSHEEERLEHPELVEGERHSSSEDVPYEDNTTEEIQSPEVELDDKCEEEHQKEVSSELIDTNISAEETEKSVCIIDSTVIESSSNDQEDPNMETSFQLNPDAKEFIPVSPLSARMNLMPGVISGSPLKHVPMDDISVPTQKEFEEEVCKRPHEFEDEEQTNGNHADRDITDFFGEKQKVCGVGLDESEISSTKAEFGDESTTSFLTATEFQRTGISMDNSFADLERDDYDISKDPMAMSFTPSDFEAVLDKKPVDLNAVHMLSGDEKEDDEDEKGLDSENDAEDVCARREVIPESPETQDPADSTTCPEQELLAETRAMSITQEEIGKTTVAEPEKSHDILADNLHDVQSEPEVVSSEVASPVEQESQQISKSEPSSMSDEFGIERNAEPGADFQFDQMQHSSTFEADMLKHAEEGSEEPTALIDSQNLQPTSNDQDTPSALSPVPDAMGANLPQQDLISSMENLKINSESTEYKPDVASLHSDMLEFYPREQADPFAVTEPAFCLTNDREEAMRAAAMINQMETNVEAAFVENAETLLDTAPIIETHFDKPADQNLLDFGVESKESSMEPVREIVEIENKEEATQECLLSREKAATPTLIHDANALVCPFGSNKQVEEATFEKEPVESVDVLVSTQNEHDFETCKSETTSTGAAINLSESMQEFTGLERELAPEPVVPEISAALEDLMSKDIISDNIMPEFTNFSAPVVPQEAPPVIDEVPPKSPVVETVLTKEPEPVKIEPIVENIVKEETESLEKPVESALVLEESKPIETAVEALEEEPVESVPEIKEPQISKVLAPEPEEPKQKEETSSPIPVAAVAVAGAAAVAAGAAAVTATAVSKTKTATKPTTAKTTKTAPTTKSTKSTPTSPSKSVTASTRTSMSATATKRSAMSTTTRPKPSEPAKKEEKTAVSSLAAKAAPKTTAAPKPTTKPAPRPLSSVAKPKVSSTATKSATMSASDKKPTANGEVKAPTKPLASRPAPRPTTTSTTTRTSTLTRTSVSRTPPTGTTTTKPRATSAVAASSKTTTAKTTTTTTTTATTRPKTAPVSNSTAKSRVPTGKSPVIDKQIKETANKQISMARTSTASKTTARTSAFGTTSVATKRVSTSKTSATASSPTKKPVASKVQSRTSTKSPNVTPKSKIVQNGVSENTAITNKIEDDLPQKDLSPVAPPTDNQLIVSAD